MFHSVLVEVCRTALWPRRFMVKICMIHRQTCESKEREETKALGNMEHE